MEVRCDSAFPSSFKHLVGSKPKPHRHRKKSSAVGFGTKDNKTKNPKTKNISTMKKVLNRALLLIVLAIGLSTASCGGDGEDVDASELGTTLMQGKWVSKNFDDIYGDDWVLADQETTTLYFVNDHECVVYYFRRSYDSDDGASYTRKGETVTYEVSGNNITLYGSNLLATGGFTYSSGSLLDGYGSMFERQTKSSDDQTNITKYYKNTDYQNIDDVVEKNVSISSSYDDFIHTVVIKSSLSTLYPKATIKYGVEYGYNEYTYEHVCGTNGSSYTVNVSVCLDNESMYITSFRALQKKKAAGETLSSDEKQLMNEIKPKIRSAAKKFQGRVFVDVEGERYYAYYLPTLSYTEIDKDLK